MRRTARAIALFLLGMTVSTGRAAAEAPPEVQGLRFAPGAGATLAWDAAPGASAYDVYRGTRADGADLRCLAFRTPATTFDDAARPASPGGLLTYLVAAWNPDGAGPLGAASHGTPRVPQVACADTDGDGAWDLADNCPLAFNPAQADQDADGAGDLCDAKTYAFELDLPGGRPAEMTQSGAANATFVVQDAGGDLAVAYDTNLGAADRFDRLELARRFQDQVIWIDTRDRAGEYFDLFLWNEGTHAENAGAALLFRIDAGGGVLAYQRLGNEYALLGTGSAGNPERLRLRLEKRAGTATRLHVDAFASGRGDVSGSYVPDAADGPASYVEDAAVFDLADDRRLFGRALALTDIGGGRRPLLRLTAQAVAPAGAFSIHRSYDGLDDWKLFQRGPAGTADVVVPFAYATDAPATVEAALYPSAGGAAVPGFGFADHRAALGPGAGNGSLPLPAVPAGGNYDLHARLVRDADGAILGEDVVAQVAVGDVFLAAGQSNMSGYSGTLADAEPPVDHVHLFGNDYRWKRAQEPMDDGTDQVDRVSGEAPQHSLMLRFAKEVAAGTGVPVAIVPAPLGGTNLYAQWQRNAADPRHRGTLYGSSIHRVLALNQPHPIRGVIWYQGESDNGRGRDVYLADLRRLVRDYRDDLGAPDLFFGNCQLANYAYSDMDTWVQIQDAQRVQGKDPGSAAVALLDLPLADTIHLNVAGYKTAGARLARAVLAGAYGLPQVQGPRLVRLEFNASKTAIRVIYDKDVTGGQAALFRVHENGVPVTVSAVTTSGKAVLLQLPRAVTGDVRTSYGYARYATSPWVLAADGSGPALAFWRVPIGDQ